MAVILLQLSLAIRAQTLAAMDAYTARSACGTSCFVRLQVWKAEAYPSFPKPDLMKPQKCWELSSCKSACGRAAHSTRREEEAPSSLP